MTNNEIIKGIKQIKKDIAIDTDKMIDSDYEYMLPGLIIEYHNITVEIPLHYATINNYIQETLYQLIETFDYLENG